MGVATQNWTKGSMSWIGLSRCAGPMHQPVCQPVIEKVLPAEESVTVRSNMPGSEAKCWCGSPAYTVYLYTSSEMTSSRGWRLTTSAIASISALLNVLPVGLCGEFRTSSLVRGEIAASSLSGSSVQRRPVSSTSNGTGTTEPPAIRTWP